MKSQTSSKWIVLTAALVCAPFAPVLLAQAPAPALTREDAPVQLSADVWDVLRLARGNVSEHRHRLY